VVLIDAQRTLRLVTNDLDAPARKIAEIYQTRWQIELGACEPAISLPSITRAIAHPLSRLARNSRPAAPSLPRRLREART
jgi:hypothetical protein